MNTFDFFRLIYTIYNKKKPDIKFIESLGLLAIKIGQVHALRIDFLSEETCQELSKLYRSVQAVSAEDVDLLLAEQAPANFLDNFSSFSKTPFASASVGQVHKGTLTNGDVVAVKLIKKRFTKSFKQDVRKAQQIFKVLTFLYPKLRGVANPASLLRGIEKTTLAELNLQNEIAGQKILSKIVEENAEKFDLSTLAFPKLYEDISNESVLVSEYVEGVTYDELLSKGELSYERLLELFHLHGFFMFVIGTFHGDLHPGNIIQQGEKVYLLDTGYIGSVSDQIRVNLFKYFDALSQYDYPESAKYLHQMSKRQISDQKFAVFLEQYLDLYKDFTNTTVSQMSLTKKMMQTIKLGVLSGMEFEEGIFDIIKSLMYMDGMVLRCNPDAVLLKDMRKFIGEFKELV